MTASGGQAIGTRSSVLWGSGGKRGGSTSKGFKGKGGRSGLFAIVVAFAALAAPWAASAPQAGPTPAPGSGSSNVFIPTTLLAEAQASPRDTFNVIVQGDGSAGAAHVAREVAEFAAKANHELEDAAHKTDDTLKRAQDTAAPLVQLAAKARADAAAKVRKAATSGKTSDRDAATKAAQAAVQAQQRADAATAALAQAQTAADAAHAGLVQLAGKILRQQITDRFSSITGVAATLTGDQIDNLASHVGGGLLSITPNAPVSTGDPGTVQGSSVPAAQKGTSALAGGAANWSSNQLWPYASKSANNWSRDRDPRFASSLPTIAIVDSGVESRSDFGSRLIASVNLSTLPNNSAGDGRGHGTFVAGIAADGLPGVTGAAPSANLVSLDIMDDSGMGMTSDIIAACQWILDHKAQYNIRVANFSLQSSITAPFYIDPLDRAVEQLWFNGVVVVVAAGNYGTADGPSGVTYSPGNDPFVITVGAADLNGSTDPNQATMAPWSAWGSTIDGFAKPELSAPGRYMIGAVPETSTLVSERPGSITSPGYMQLSGTSFAAPVVSGAAANILAQHPSFTPDQVKGALMLTARELAKSVGDAGGVGLVQAGDAVGPSNPPNANAGLAQFVVRESGDGSEGRIFDSASWHSAAEGNASWNSASWNSASWNSASWHSASWNSASWNSASWHSASWNSASWHSASWNSASWHSASREDAADDDASPLSSLTLSAAQVAALLAELAK